MIQKFISGNNENEIRLRKTIFWLGLGRRKKYEITENAEL